MMAEKQNSIDSVSFHILQQKSLLKIAKQTQVKEKALKKKVPRGQMDIRNNKFL